MMEMDMCDDEMNYAYAIKCDGSEARFLTKEEQS
jgi:hypothetical protein